MSMNNDEQETLCNLSENEREILGRMVLRLSKDYSFNEVQKEMVSKVLSSFHLSDIRAGELGIIESIDNITAQKTIFRVLSELLFLNNRSLEEALELSELFSINKKNIETILKDIVCMYSKLGDRGIIERYCQPIPIKGKQNNCPKLEVDSSIYEYYVDSIMFAGELDMGDDFDAEFDTYETEAEYKRTMGEIIHKYYKQQQRYVSPQGDRFVGKELSRYYYMEVKAILDKIIDFVNVHNIEVDIAFLKKLIDEMEDDILQEIKREMKSSDLLYSVTDWKDYVDMLAVDEVDDILIKRFGEIVDVIRYQESNTGTDLFEIVQNMEAEINRIFDWLKKVTHDFVIEKYMNRINYFRC